ncbi:hypothetical protein FQN49_000109 [Arthroderma sp. PD_2]|nr:hypothetical protein FQN49_000109 [Arthroderma sp. PD_2]
MTLTNPPSSSRAGGRGQQHNSSQSQGNSKPVVVSVDGVCKGNGTGHARSGAGIYLGPGSRFNESIPLSMDNPTNQKAELLAGIHGLNKAREMDTSHVVVKSDSEYMVKAVNEWSRNWESNGYRNANGQPVANADLFQRLNESVRTLEESGVRVDLQHVPREQNQDADRWANRSFSDRYPSPSYSHHQQPGNYDGSDDSYHEPSDFHLSDPDVESSGHYYELSDHHHESSDNCHDSEPYIESDDYYNDNSEPCIESDDYYYDD